MVEQNAHLAEGIKEVLFLEPAHLTRPFFSNLYYACESRIYEKFNRWRPIRRCIPRSANEFDTATVINVLTRELGHSNAIKLLVVAPTASEELTRGIARAV